MKPYIVAFSVLAGALILPQAARADTFTLDLASSDASVTFDATLTLRSTAASSAAGSGVYDITQITGTYTDTNSGGVSGTITGIAASDGTLSVSSDGLFVYDDLLDAARTTFSGSNLDGNGIVFYLSDGAEVSLYGTDDGTGNYWSLEATGGTSGNSAYLSSVGSATTVTPEPSSFLLFGSGLLLLASPLIRRRLFSE